MTARRLPDFLFDTAARSPEARAIVGDGTSLKYGELGRIAAAMTARLEDRAIGSGERVALLAEKSPMAIAAICGTMGADCIHVPLDADSPPARLKLILGAARPSAIWCQSTDAVRARLRDALPPGVDVPVLELETPDAWMSPGMSPAPGAAPGETASTEIAQLLFTSGSTGVPKGVMVTHTNVVAFVDWAGAHFGIGADDRVSGHSPLAFDLATWDIFGAFAAGAELHPVPSGFNLFPQKVLAFMRERRLTQWFSVPSLLAYMARFDVLKQDDLPDLKRLIWCGEVFPTTPLRYWMTRLPHVRFTNLYGPTETTIASSVYEVRDVPGENDPPVPIGRACGGESLYVIDEALREAPAGETGEIVIGGVGVTLGYWEDRAKTAERFVVAPDLDAEGPVYRTGDLGRADAEGVVHFLGRADTQIKSRGHRIELGEIENAVLAVDGIGEAAVVAIATDDFANVEIACAYALKPERQLSAAELRKQVAVSLPRYMLPSQWRELLTFPKNANGKIDRLRVQALFDQNAG